jgi:hypothetical protein
MEEPSLWIAGSLPFWAYRLSSALMAQVSLIALELLQASASAVVAYAAAVASISPLVVLVTSTNHIYARQISLLLEQGDLGGLWRLWRAARLAFPHPDCFPDPDPRISSQNTGAFRSLVCGRRKRRFKPSRNFWHMQSPQWDFMPLRHGWRGGISTFAAQFAIEITSRMIIQSWRDSRLYDRQIVCVLSRPISG